MKLRLRRAVAAASVALLAGLALGAVALTGASAAASSKKAPVTILATAPINDPAYSGPNWTDEVVVWGDMMNAKGGIDGHKVNVVTCDNVLTTAGTVTCAQEAVADHAVAMVGFALGNSAMLQVLSAAHIPWVPGDAATAVELNNLDSYPVDLTAFFQTAAEADLAIKDKCKSTAIYLPSTLVGQGSLQKAEMASQGLSNISLITVPVTATDLTSYISQAASSTCLLLSGVSEVQYPAVANAITEDNAKFANIISSPSLTQSIVSANPALWNGAQIGSSVSDEGDPIWNQYKAAVAKYNDLGGFDNAKAPFSACEGGWIAMEILGSVLSYDATHGNGQLTGTRVISALNSNHAWSANGTAAPVNFTHGEGPTGTRRLFAPIAYFQTVAKGKITGAFGNKGTNILNLILQKPAG